MAVKFRREIIAKARADGRDALTEVESKQVFSAYGLPDRTNHPGQVRRRSSGNGEKDRLPGCNENRLPADSAQIRCRRRQSQRER